MTFFWLVGGEVTEHCSRKSCAQPQVTILHLGGGLSSYRTAQRYCCVFPLGRNQDPARSWNYCFSTAFPLSLHSLTLLIIWICPLELKQGLGGRNFSPTNKKWGTWKGIYKGKVLWGLAGFQFPLFFATHQSWQGTGSGQEREKSFG